MKINFLWMILTWFLVLLFIPGANCFSQDFYFVNGKVFVNDNKFNDVTVILSSGNENQELPVTSYGVFSAGLQWNKKYYFTFRKPGYISKKIEFSTFIPEDHTRRIEPYVLNVRLFPMIEGVDTAFFKKPVAKIYFDKGLNDFTDDRDYALQVIYEIDKMVTKAKKNAATANGSKTNPKTSKKVNVATVKNTEGETRDSAVQEILGRSYELHADKNSLDNILPPLKENYTEEKTVEEFDVDDMHVTRVIIRDGDSYKVFIRVKHNWGGVFYFIDESPLGFFSITKSLFERETNIRESKNSVNADTD